MIDVPVLSVSWSFEDHSVIIQALRKGLVEHEASDTGGVPRWKSSCPDRLAEATDHRACISLGGRIASRTLGVLDVDGQKERFCVKNTHIHAKYADSSSYISTRYQKKKEGILAKARGFLWS